MMVAPRFVSPLLLVVQLPVTVENLDRSIRFATIGCRWNREPADFKTAEKRLFHDPRVVMAGRDALADFSALVKRRLIEAAMKGRRRSQLVAASGCHARLDDLAQFLRGTVDLDKILSLARAFMAIKWNVWSPADCPLSSQSSDQPEEAWLAIRLANLAWPLTANKDIPADPRIVRRLLAGDGCAAVAIALSRLRASGIRPPLQAGVTDVSSARRWAAALVFPINHNSAAPWRCHS